MGDRDRLVWEDLVSVGRVARPQGRKGEVVVESLTDFPDRFSGLERLFVLDVEGSVVAAPIEWTREQGGRPVVKFKGVDGITEAERLKDKELRVTEAELRPLRPGAFYVFQLRGLSVWDDRVGRLGEVEDVVQTGGTDLLLVRGASGEEVLVPLCEEICSSIDRASGRIEIHAPEGLLTINAH